MPRLAEVQTEEVGVVTQSWPQKTLRDEFAMAALAEFANFVSVNKPETYKAVAELSYFMADAMLSARAK